MNRQSIFFALALLAAYALGNLSGGSRASASDPITREDARDLIRAVEKISDSIDRAHQ